MDPLYAHLANRPTGAWQLVLVGAVDHLDQNGYRAIDSNAPQQGFLQ